MKLPDYYAVLEIYPTATSEQIKQAYRKLVRLHHPDLTRQQQDSKIKRLNEAYEVLSDPQKRAAYNAMLLQEYQRIMAQQAQQAQQTGATTPPKPRTPRQKKQEEHKMTWAEGFKGFVEELKKGLREE